MSYRNAPRLLAVVLLLTPVASQLEARQEPATLKPGVKLYVSQMEWNLDRYVVTEIRKQGTRVEMVPRAEDADFVMSSLYQKLGSHLISPGHYIQVKIVAADGGKEVWSAQASDFALFFGRLRPHGPRRAAQTIVKKLGKDIASAGR